MKLSVVLPISACPFGRAPHGARGLKFRRRFNGYRPHGRAPHGARGLKLSACGRGQRGLRSRPARGAWIEIVGGAVLVEQVGESRPARGAWIEIFPPLRCPRRWAGRAPHGARGLKYLRRMPCRRSSRSRPARGAWIEISKTADGVFPTEVAPRTGRVD